MDQPVGPQRGEEPEDERARQLRQRRAARRTTVILVAVVLVLYFGYILYALLSGLHARH
ncbi:MAG TPA: hypothetical protein VHY19_10040 [Steroidobacteraceae bacterium]|nr:hypothetical protein [Steroidobacteraceae bacterium]